MISFTDSIPVSPTHVSAAQGPCEEILHGPRATIVQQAVDTSARRGVWSEKILLGFGARRRHCLRHPHLRHLRSEALPRRSAEAARGLWRPQAPALPPEARDDGIQNRSVKAGKRRPYPQIARGGAERRRSRYLLAHPGVSPRSNPPPLLVVTQHRSSRPYERR